MKLSVLVARLALIDATRRDDPEVEIVPEPGTGSIGLVGISEGHHVVTLTVDGPGLWPDTEIETRTRTVYRDICPEGCAE